MVIESPELLEECIARLEALRQEYCDDLEAVLDGWLEASSDQIACRLANLDHDLAVLRDRLKSANSRVRRYKDRGVLINN